MSSIRVLNVHKLVGENVRIDRGGLNLKDFIIKEDDEETKRDYFYEIKKEKATKIARIEAFVESHVTGKKIEPDKIKEGYTYLEGERNITFSEFVDFVNLEGVNIESAKHLGMGIVNMIYQRIYRENQNIRRKKL